MLSFVNVGIYWNNHHHLLQAARQVDGRILWANLNLLFWLSLFPFVTGWMGENHFAACRRRSTAWCCSWPAVAYFVLQRAIVVARRAGLGAGRAVGPDRKGRLSRLRTPLAIPAALLRRGSPGRIYIAVAMVWFVPDRRIERALGRASD